MDDKVEKMEACRQFKNTVRLANDLSQLDSMPELYDVHFIVGKQKEHVGGVKAILAARSRVFFNLLFTGNGGRHSSANQNMATKKYTPKQGFAFLKRDGKMQTSHATDNIRIDYFEPEEFTRLMVFLHCGSCAIDASCIVGLLAASNYFAVAELHAAIWKFLDKCISVENVCHFFSDVEKYIQFKPIKALIPKLLEFTATNAGEILGLVPFCSLPQHIVRLILSRSDLDATEWEKFTAVLAWGHSYCNRHKDAVLKDALEPMIDCIAFYKIPTVQLMQEVRELGVVPDHVLMKALAYQADPSSVEVKCINARGKGFGNETMVACKVKTTTTSQGKLKNLKIH